MKGYEIFTKEKIVYLYKATKPIKYKKLQDRIYFELSNHIDDMFCDYINEGMSEEDATEKFLNEMGSPEELGEELKKAHSKTLLFAKLQKAAILMVVLALIISAFGYFEAKDNIDLAKYYELPEETVELEKNLITYTKLEYWSFPIDIYFYTNINWLEIKTTTPLYKVKDYNLFNDYYILDESQSVIVDLGCATHGDGTIYIDDISKLPANYHSDKLSKVVLANHETDLSLELNLTVDEVLELEKLAFPNDNDKQEDLEFGKLIMAGENEPYDWSIQFHIKDLEGLYYYPWHTFYKSVDGKYYIGDWYYGTGNGHMYVEIPEHLADKIDKSFEDANIEF